MSARAVSPRVLVLVSVAALHALVLLALATATRARLVPRLADTVPLMLMLLEPRERPRTAAPPPRVPPTHAAPRDARPPAAAEPDDAPPAAPPAGSTAIDWSQEAAASARNQLAAEALHAAQAAALAPRKSALFAAQPKRPGFRWDYASTHRVEAVPGLATVIHLNDQCAVTLFLFIPFAAGCTLDKPAARGDLFDHMHGPQP